MTQLANQTDQNTTLTHFDMLTSLSHNITINQQNSCPLLQDNLSVTNGLFRCKKYE
jgi:hypothetical protein